MKLALVLAAYLACAAAIPGGRSPLENANLTSSEAVFAVQQIGEQAEDGKSREGVRILEATQQVVNGFIYRYKIEVTGGEAGNEICDVAVWNQRGSLSITEPITCEANSYSVKKNENSEASQALEELVQYINMVTNSLNYRAVKNEPTYTKLSGDGSTTYSFSNVQLADTYCTNNGPRPNKGDCLPNSRAETSATCSGSVESRDGSFEPTFDGCSS